MGNFLGEALTRAVLASLGWITLETRTRRKMKKRVVGPHVGMLAWLLLLPLVLSLSLSLSWVVICGGFIFSIKEFGSLVEGF